MARPPLPPRSQSPSIQSFCSSDESFAGAGLAENIGSHRIQEFFESFDAAERFSQVDADGGRGIQVVRQMHAMLTTIWMGRDELNPALCFDKHDGREDGIIYHPPQRQPGGIVFPVRLAGTRESEGFGTQRVNIVHNHVSVISENKGIRENKDRGRDGSSKRRKVQSTLRSVSRGEKSTRQRNQGKFVRKSLVPIAERRSTIVSIPLAPGGVRDILHQWVVGDPSKGLQTPLAEFTYEMINAKGPNGKSHKSLYSKRRTISVAVLLALREAIERTVPLTNVLGIRHDHDICKLSITNWEKYGREYLRKGRKLSRQEIIDLGNQVYNKEYLDLLPN